MPNIDPNIFMLLVFLTSIAGGVLGAMLGLGGGVVVIPVLTLVFGVDIHYAFGASIVSIIATSSGAAASYVKDRITNIRVGMFLEVATTLGALTGVTLLAFFKSNLLYIIFGSVLVLSSIPVVLRQREYYGDQGDRLADCLRMNGDYFDSSLGREVHYTARRPQWALGINYVAGIISGLLGLGSGPLKVLSMDTVMRLPIKASTATSNFMIGVTAAASAGIYFFRGYVNPFLVAPVALGVLVGALAGARIMPGARSLVIRRVFVGVLGLVAIQMILRGLGVAV